MFVNNFSIFTILFLSELYIRADSTLFIALFGDSGYLDCPHKTRDVSILIARITFAGVAELNGITD